VPSRSERPSPPEPIVGPPSTTATSTPPLHTSSTQDHSFPLQLAMQMSQQLGELKAGLDAVSKSVEKLDAKLDAKLEKHDAKLDSLTEALQTAKGFLKALGWIGGLIGAIGLTMLGVICKMLADHFSKL
jgi:hypothetical protein